MRVVDKEQLKPCLALGLDLIPIKPWDSMHKGRSTGKAPRDNEWVIAKYRRDAILDWIKRGGNLGVRLRRDQIVVDVDPKHADADGRSAWDLVDELELELGVDLSLAPVVETGSGGLHLYFTKPVNARVRNSTELFGGAVEYKSYGRQVLAAGSKHPNAKLYTWVRNQDGPIPPIPGPLLSLIEKPETPAGEDRSGCLSTQQIKECLDQLDPTEFRDYDAWRNVLFSVHYSCDGSEEGLEAFAEWSTADPQYANARESIEQFWGHASQRRSDARTEKTLFWYVVQAGGTVPVNLESLDEISAPPSEEEDGEERPLPQFEREPKTGKIRHGIADNVVAACRYLGIGVREDVFSGRQELIDRRDVVAGHFEWTKDGQELTDDVAALVALTITREIPGWTGDPSDATMNRAERAIVVRDHPLQRWLTSLEWDGKHRLSTWLIEASNLEDNEYNRAVSRLLLKAAVARVMQPGIKFDAMVILEGPQGGYKSTLIKWLGAQWAADGLPPIGGYNHKDVVDAMRGKWLIEIDELASMKKSDVDVLKSFLSKTEDRTRLPYQRRTQTFPRQSVFIGTTNDQEYLRDITGNRRFLPLAVGVIHDVTDVPREQLWAEAVEEWRSEPQTDEVSLPVDIRSAATYIQESRRIRDPWEDRLEEFFETKWQGEDQLSVDTVMFEALQIQMQRANPADYRRLSQVMQKLGWERARVYIEGRQVRGYQRKRKD